MWTKLKALLGRPLLSNPKAGPPQRLHVGSGGVRLEGWVNIDMQALPGVDVVADVTKGLRFHGVEAIFAEHFLEHLRVDDAISFLLEAHRVLAADAWIRLSTPNLDWVWLTHYRLEGEPAARRADAVTLNRAFHGWEHRFLWNRELLEEALVSCGFDSVRWCRWGESELPIFQGIERHATYDDGERLPHVLVAEAKKGLPQPERLGKLRDFLVRDFLNHLAG
ncbi:MAG TPA: hypothetical protein VHC97_01315 [Thermoanaerobaculia bacterium]|jgi:hypothetical protein|nr:hypothetical protein [Thermoanaerobaculia bacterium]